jgi:hypothetical protein
MDLQTVPFYESDDGDIEISRLAYVGVRMGDTSERHIRDWNIFPSLLQILFSTTGPTTQ